jgi:SNF2 family DNA or RNA helicase
VRRERKTICNISEKQRSIYLKILASPDVQAILDKRMAAFKVITTLRKLCNHPALAYQKGKIKWKRN